MHPVGVWIFKKLRRHRSGLYS